MNKLDVFIVEDDENDCNALIDEIKANSDKLHFVGNSKSANEALAFIRNHSPHAVILDLELQGGSGDGLALLDKLHSTVLKRTPYIVVNTRGTSKVRRDTAKMKGADHEFSKSQIGYSPKMVIDHLLLVMPSILGGKQEPPAELTEAQLENKMRDFLHSKFNKLGLKLKNEGYDYLVDAVILAANDENNNWNKIISEKYGKSKDSVTKAMKYAIKTNWTKSNTNDLLNYPGTLRKGEDSPTVTDFILTYKQQLISYINK